jgi:pimeloyl-ACP methyl ester carboxylesterase
VVLIGGWTPFARLSKSILWPVGQLDRAGYDVVIPHWSTEAGHVLNRRRHMWVSRPRQTTRQVLLARDPSRNIVEHAAATTIVGQLLKLAHELGHTSIAVWGTSLGAHLVALLATRRVPIHAGLYVLEKPLCRLSDPLRLHGRGGIVQRHAIADRLDRVYQCVSPLDRPLQVDAQDILVIGGEYDQIAPISGAKLLANHLGAPLQQIAASHVFDPHRTRRILEILQNNAHQY